ncbi:MAG TPA: hypothetical protein VN282_13960 [Pyrinomonadaceae bacterium]|nr:hypothetical protein [Pyrinomonadaceae bacterium]
MFWVFALLFLIVLYGVLVRYARSVARKKKEMRGRRHRATRSGSSSESYDGGSGLAHTHYGGHSDYASSSEGAYSSSSDYGGGGDFGGGGAGGDFGGGDSGGDGGGGGGDGGGGE